MEQRIIDALNSANYPSKGNVFATINDILSSIKIESGNFTLSANGLAGTGGTLTNPGANPTLIISTTKKLKLAHFNTSATSFGSLGKDDGVLADCLSTNSNGVGSDLTVSINAGQAGKTLNGWTGKITQINSTSFAITFTQVGTGDAISCNYHLITE